MGKESHFTSKKPRTFVRGIEGHYNLKEELARLRSIPRVIRGKELKFNDGPQAFSRHYMEPIDGMGQTLHIHLEEYAPERQESEARTRQRGGVLHPRRRRLRDSRRHPLRLESRRRGGRPQQLRAPASQRQRHQAGPRAGDEDQADVPLHEHAVPENRWCRGRPSRRPAAKVFNHGTTNTTSTMTRNVSFTLPGSRCSVRVQCSGPAEAGQYVRLSA